MGLSTSHALNNSFFKIWLPLSWKKKLNVPNSSSNELNDIRSVCQKMRKSLQNITPLLSTEQAFKHSDVFLHPLYPTTAPAFTLLEGTDASASKLTSYRVMYSIRNTSFERAFPPSGPCQHAFGNRRPSPPPPPDHFIFSEPPTPPCSFPPSAHRKEPRPNDTVRHPLEGKDIRCIPSGARLSLGSWVGNLAGPPWERRSMKRDGGGGEN